MNKQKRNTKKLLDRFYRAILVWILNPEKNEYGFDAGNGLCDNLNYYLYQEVHTHNIGGLVTRDAVHEMQQAMFMEAYGTHQTPFNASMDHYFMESSAGTLYTNKDRLAFIVNQVVSKDLQEEIHAVATRQTMLEKDGCMAAGLCCRVCAAEEMKRWFDAAYGHRMFPFEQDAVDKVAKYLADQRSWALYKNPARLHFIEVMTSAVRDA